MVGVGRLDALERKVLLNFHKKYDRLMESVLVKRCNNRR